MRGQLPCRPTPSSPTPGTRSSTAPLNWTLRILAFWGTMHLGMVCFCWIMFFKLKFNQYVLVPVYEDFASCGRRTGAKRRAPALPRWFLNHLPWPILTLVLHQYSFPVNLALPAPPLVLHSTQTDKLPVQCQLQRNDCIGAMPSSYNKECIVLGQLICHSLIKLWWQKTAFMFDTVFRSVRRTIYYCIQAQIIFI